MLFRLNEEPPPKLHSCATQDPVESGKDLPGGIIMAQNGDPDYEAIATALAQANSWDFIATERSRWKYLIGDNGRIIIQTTLKMDDGAANYRKEVYCAFDPARHGLSYTGCKGRQTLLNGYLPVNVTMFDLGRDKHEQQAFAWTEDNGGTFIYIKVTSRDTPLFFKAPEPGVNNPAALLRHPYAATRLENGMEFESKLRALRRKWDEFFKNTMIVAIPDRRLANAARNAIIKSFHACVGNAIHYGATRYFCDDGQCAKSFPPTTTTMSDCCVGWGVFPKARELLHFFLENFVTNDGHLLHRGNGASISEHGMLLESIANYTLSSGDPDLLESHAGKILKLCGFLIEARQKGKRLPMTSVNHGLIKGCPEDDVRYWEHEFWYSGNAWACRGLKEISRVLILSPSVALREFGMRFTDEAGEFRRDINRSARAVAMGGFIPPYPDCQVISDMNGDIFHPQDKTSHMLPMSSYANYRFYPEMLSAGIFDKDISEKIITYRESHGGEFLGLTKIKIKGESLLDDWPLYNQLRGLLEMDMKKKFLMTIYAHMAHHQSRDTFFAPESTGYGRLDSIHCVPSQLTAPLSLRWALVYEERDSGALCIGRGAPDTWYDDSVSVQNAPARGGRVSYTAITEKGGIRMEIETSGKITAKEIRVFTPCDRRLNVGIKTESGRQELAFDSIAMSYPRTIPLQGS